MAYDSDDRHFTKLVELTEWSYREQRADRDIHRNIVWHLGGQYYPTVYGEEGMDTPINLLSMASRSMSRSLISKAPRCLISTDSPQLKSWSEDAEISTNKRIVKSNLDRVLRDVVAQSMSSMGIFFLAADYVGTKDGMRLDLVMKSVDRCDYVYDLQSTTVEEADIQGHKFRMPLRDVREHPMFDEEARQQVGASPTSPWPEGDENDLRRSRRRSTHDLYEYVDIWCIYEPRRGKIWYYPAHQMTIKLAELEWTGPRHGPYRYLYYERLPNHAVPLSPLMHLLKKHRAFNLLDSKAIDQQQTAKGNLFYSNASKADAERIINSYNNQSTLQENGAIRWAHIGGAAPDTVAMAEKQKRDFSYAAGGMDTYAGLSGQGAETLGESRLLMGAANAMLEDMGGYAYQFVKGVVGDIFWFDIRDPDPRQQTLRKPIEGTEMSYEVEWSPERRQQIAEMEFDVDVVPYSYKERSPESILADMLSAVKMVVEMGPMAMAQGVTVDVAGVMKTVAKLRNLTTLNDLIITNQDPAELAQFAGGAPPLSGDSGPRRYIRESRSDGAGVEQEMMRAMGRGQQQQDIQVA